jgi:hypothetical protein
MARQIAEDIQREDSARKVVVLDDHGGEVYKAQIDLAPEDDTPM